MPNVIVLRGDSEAKADKIIGIANTVAVRRSALHASRREGGDMRGFNFGRIRVMAL